MTLDLYSLLLSISVLALGTITLLILIGYIGSSQVRAKIQDIPYFRIVQFIGFLSIFSTI